jgi:hypothetical protein
VVQKPGTATVTPGELRRELSRGDVAGPDLLEPALRATDGGRRPQYIEARTEPSRRRRARR